MTDVGRRLDRRGQIAKKNLPRPSVSRRSIQSLADSGDRGKDTIPSHFFYFPFFIELFPCGNSRDVEIRNARTGASLPLSLSLRIRTQRDERVHHGGAFLHLPVENETDLRFLLIESPFSTSN